MFFNTMLNIFSIPHVFGMYFCLIPKICKIGISDLRDFKENIHKFIQYTTFILLKQLQISMVFDQISLCRCQIQ